MAAILDRLAFHGRSRNVVKILVGVSIGLLILSPVSRLLAAVARRTVVEDLDGSIAQFFAIDAEKNLPTAASASFLGAAGLLFGAYGIRGTPRARAGWLLAGLGCVAMAADEWLIIHERLLDSAAEEIVGAGQGGPARWVVAGVVVGAAGLVAAWTVLRAAPPWARHDLLIAGAVFLTGALGFEVLSLLSPDADSNGPLYTALNLIEEGLEFAGAVLAIGVGVELHSQAAQDC